MGDDSVQMRGVSDPTDEARGSVWRMVDDEVVEEGPQQPRARAAPHHDLVDGVVRGWIGHGLTIAEAGTQVLTRCDISPG